MLDEPDIKSPLDDNEPVDAPRPESNWSASAQPGIMAGEFAIDDNHVIVQWDEGLEGLTGRTASQMLGTRFQWEPLYGFERPVLADLYLDGDFEAARKLYGTARVWRHKQSDEWVAIGQCLDPDARCHPVLARVSRRGAEGYVTETLYSIERAADWFRMCGDRYDGLSVLAENVPAGVALMQDERLLFANQTFCRMFGYSGPAELIGRRTGDFLIEEQRDRHYQVIYSLKKGESREAKFQWTGLSRTGEKIWFEARPTPIEWNGRPAILSFILDITEYKRREEFMAQESQELRLENVRLKSSIDYHTRLGNIIGKSRKMQEVFDTILRSAHSESAIVIYGETGTGKELVAKAVHGLGRRSAGPFVPVNCGAIPKELFESEFFGARKGAYTGAYADKPGFLSQAQGGTLFLDEIGELDLYCQAKLLRVLGSGEYTPVGDPKPRKTDFRVLSATNRSLEAMVKQSVFREDLFYRLHVIPIHLPPLRDRREDIPFLVEHILYKLGAAHSMSSRDLSILLEHPWPGNVRELHNVLERYVALGNLNFLHLNGAAENPGGGEVDPEAGLRGQIASQERQLIVSILEKCDGNRSKTAQALGLPRKTLFRKMKKLGIE